MIVPKDILGILLDNTLSTKWQIHRHTRWDR